VGRVWIFSGTTHCFIMPCFSFGTLQHFGIFYFILFSFTLLTLNDTVFCSQKLKTLQHNFLIQNAPINHGGQDTVVSPNHFFEFHGCPLPKNIVSVLF